MAVWQIVQEIPKLKSANIKFTITLYNVLQAKWLVGVVYQFNLLHRSRGVDVCTTVSSVLEMALYRYFALSSVPTRASTLS